MNGTGLWPGLFKIGYDAVFREVAVCHLTARTSLCQVSGHRRLSASWHPDRGYCEPASFKRRAAHCMGPNRLRFEEITDSYLGVNNMEIQKFLCFYI
jgi:hypothetical protein